MNSNNNYKRVEKFRKIEKEKEARLDKLKFKDLDNFKNNFLQIFRRFYPGPTVLYFNFNLEVINLLENSFHINEFEASCLIDLLNATNSHIKNKTVNDFVALGQIIRFIFENKQLRNAYRKYYEVKKAKEFKKVKHSNPSARIISVGMGRK